MQVIEHQDLMIINDAYNANPTSMESALHTLKTLSCRGKKIAILGDMFELGALSQAAHYHVGQLAALVPVDSIFLLGKYAGDVVQGARSAGMKPGQIVIGESHEHLAAELASQIKAGDVVLCKASRGMTMEKVIEHLLKLLSL
jgi:UDP-N-acetylmuramoyl-tripeptide--D-alanyl-D-alanine ligase